MGFKEIFQFSKKKKNNIDIAEIEIIDTIDVSTDTTINDDEMAKQLMILISKAIDEWSNVYGMNNLPKNIVFKQAVSIMNAWSDILGS